MTLRLPPTPTQDRLNEVYPRGTLVLDESTFELWIGDGQTKGGTQPQAVSDTGGGTSDHGALTGLTDDDHSQYHNDTRGDARYYTQAQVDAAIVDDHGALTGLGDDDHSQYLNNARGDARYYQLGEIDMGGQSLVDCGTVNCSQGIVSSAPTLGGNIVRKTELDAYIPTLDYVKVQGASGQNMNAAASNNLMAWATELNNEGSTFTWATGDNSKLTVTEACHTLIMVNVVLTSTAQRQASYMKVKLDGTTDLSERAATGYIRNSNSHTRASYHLIFPYEFTSSGYVQVYFDRASSLTTAATTQGTQNSFSIVRIG